MSSSSFHFPLASDDKDLRLIHFGLILQWNNLTQRIKDSNDVDNVREYCRDLIRVINLLQSMEETDD